MIESKGRVKRLFDFVLSLALLILAGPIVLATALAILISMGRPVIFRQARLGRCGEIFEVYKFRSMTNRVRKSHQEILGDHPDVPPVGKLIRRLKIDELPQLWNVLKGDMSIVGPRPALPSHLELYDDVSIRRLEVRPGLTGLAQISGNARLTWPERWALDVQYVETQSFWLDLRIILKTVAVVLFGEERFKRGG